MGTGVSELETFRQQWFTGIFFKNTNGKEMKMCSKVCNCWEGATRIWEVLAWVLRCHYLANLNRPQFGLLFSYFNCMVFAAARQYFNCTSFLFGNALRMSNLRKSAFASSGNWPLPCLLLSFWAWTEIKDPDTLLSREACLGRRPKREVSSPNFLQY